MPSAPPKPCRRAGCGQTTQTGYCEQHAGDRRQNKFADERRGSRHERGYDWTWEQTRKRILQRDKGICQEHRQGCRYRAVAVDHRVSKAEGRARGWSDAQIEDDGNLQSICKPCHDAKSQEEAQRARQGWP